MKTAMQEIIEWIVDKQFPVNKEFVEKTIELTMKEKEQIKNAWEKGYCTGCVVGSNDFTNEDEKTDNGNYYYKQNYK